jgi:hypothetical protein
VYLYLQRQRAWGLRSLFRKLPIIFIDKMVQGKLSTDTPPISHFMKATLNQEVKNILVTGLGLLPLGD